MNYKKIFWGVVLIIIGMLFIIRNLGWLDFSWWAIFSLWPLLLILWGISVIPVKDTIKLILSLGALALAVIFLYNYDCSDRFHIRWHSDDDKEVYIDKEGKYSNQNFSEPYDSTTKTAVLKFEAAAGNFTIDSVSTNLVDFEKKGNITNYQFTTEDSDSGKVVYFKMEDSKIHIGNKHNHNEVTLKLNANPLWNFDFDMGAADINFDLSKYKTKNISIDCGASDIDLTLGNKSLVTHVDIDAGASSIKIRVPKTSAYQVISDSFMASKNFKDARKVADGRYETADFGKNPNKIYIELNVGVSSLDVERY